MTCTHFRACYYDEDRFQELEAAVDLDKVLEETYRYFCEELPLTSCTYVHHLFMEHALESRRRTGPMYQSSCAVFEGNYRHLKRAFYPGSINIGSQGIKNTLLQHLHEHQCPEKRSLRLTNHTTRRTDDSLVFTGNNRYYRILENLGGGRYKAARVNPRQFTHAHIRLPFQLPWNLVGVRKYYGMRANKEEISRKDIKGKLVLMPGNLLVEYPSTWLLRSYM